MEAARIGWAVLAVCLTVIVVNECTKDGVPPIVAAVVFLLVPWLPWWPFRLVWIPLTVVVVYTFGLFLWQPFFTAGLGWLTGIAACRAVRGTETRLRA